MREYCTEAARYGDQLLPLPQEPKRILVILNPAANKKSAKENFENYCEPILHLSGHLVEIVQTDSEGHARRYVEELPSLPDALLIAGGEGAISEAITGLFRRERQDSCPVGILPVGRTNSVAKRFFFPSKDPSAVEEVQGLANAAIAVVRGHVERKDAIKIELIDTEDPPKPVYALGALQWGAYRDILAKRDKYWYFGVLREYVAFLFNGFSDDVTWECEAKLTFTDPCRGCQNCRKKVDSRAKSTRWWAKFVPRAKPAADEVDYSRVVNVNCTQTHDLEVAPTDLELVSRNLEASESELPRLQVRIGARGSGLGYSLDTWRRLWNQEELEAERTVDARSVEIRPVKVSTDEQEAFYSIDNEAFEVKPVRVSVVPEALRMFVLKKS